MEKEKIHSVAEEIRMFTGLNVYVNNGKIELDTIAGLMVYSLSEKTVMGDVYRFISHYGGKLDKWGLEWKIKESQNNYR